MQLVTGARTPLQFDVKLVVDKRKQGAFRSLSEALREAWAYLANSRSVRIEIGPGIFREVPSLLDWSEEKVRTTPLAICAALPARRPVISGSDIVPTSQLSRMPGGQFHFLVSEKLGLFGYTWTAKGQIAHRREMLFVDNQPLFPRMLESVEVLGTHQTPDAENEISYQKFTERDPAEALNPGEFGVIERENGTEYFFMPYQNSFKKVEVGARRILLDLTGKDNLLIDGLIFRNAVNDESKLSTLNALTFGMDGESSNNVTLQNCDFLFNANTGFHLDGTDWTIQNCKFNFNGGSGVASGKCKNVLFENNETSFNVWRAWRAGEVLYYTGGLKMHEVDGHLVRGHRAIGNCTAGMWWDIYCKDVFAEDVLLSDNTCNLQFEISPGPFMGRRMVLGRSRGDDGNVHFWHNGDVSLENCIFYNDVAGKGWSALLGIRYFDREDSHATMGGVLSAGTYDIKRNIFVAGGKVAFFGQLEDERNPVRPGFSHPVYRGNLNYFSHPSKADFGLQWSRDKRFQVRPFTLPVEDWLASADYQETNSIHIEMPLVAPEDGDYRLKPTPHFRPKEWPKFRLTAKEKQNLYWFSQWCGYTPDAWAPLPPE